MSGSSTYVSTSPFALVIASHPTPLPTGETRFLAVDESKNRGWWIPAGHIDAGQSPIAGAHRETSEEAGVAIRLTSLLRLEHTPRSHSSSRLRFVFGASPLDPDAPPKSQPDAESNGAAWVSLADLERMRLRGHELPQWGKALEEKGMLLAGESEDAPSGAPPPPPIELIACGYDAEEESTLPGLYRDGDGDDADDAGVEAWVLGPAREVEDSEKVLNSPLLMGDPPSDVGDVWTRRSGCPVRYVMTLMLRRKGGDDSGFEGAVVEKDVGGGVRFDQAVLDILASIPGVSSSDSDLGVIRFEYLLHGWTSATLHAVLTVDLQDSGVDACLASGLFSPLEPKQTLYSQLAFTHPLLPYPLDLVYTTEYDPARL